MCDPTEPRGQRLLFLLCELRQWHWGAGRDEKRNPRFSQEKVFGETQKYNLLMVRLISDRAPWGNVPASKFGWTGHFSQTCVAREILEKNSDWIRVWKNAR